jgi:hypothetical protein
MQTTHDDMNGKLKDEVNGVHEEKYELNVNLAALST